MTDTISAQDARRELADELELATSHWPDNQLVNIGFTAKNWRIILAALRAEPARGAEEMSLLSDPVAVHANMLRGVIAKPSVENIIHLYGAEALRRALPPHDEGGQK